MKLDNFLIPIMAWGLLNVLMIVIDSFVSEDLYFIFNFVLSLLFFFGVAVYFIFKLNLDLKESLGGAIGIYFVFFWFVPQTLFKESFMPSLFEIVFFALATLAGIFFAKGMKQD